MAADPIAVVLAREFPQLTMAECEGFAARVRGLVQARERRSDPFLAEFRGLREAAGLTLELVAQATGWSLSKVQRFEAGSSSLSRTDTCFLLDLYGVRGRGRREVLLGQAAARRSYARRG